MARGTDDKWGTMVIIVCKPTNHGYHYHTSIIQVCLNMGLPKKNADVIEKMVIKIGEVY